MMRRLAQVQQCAVQNADRVSQAIREADTINALPESGFSPLATQLRTAAKLIKQRGQLQ